MLNDIDKKPIRVLSKVDDEARWSHYNPVLLNKEIGYVRETGQYKIGDGKTRWNDLNFNEPKLTT